MNIKITLETDNAAFEPRAGTEVSRILIKLADKLRGDSLREGDGGKLMDANGNGVGTWEVQDQASNQTNNNQDAKGPRTMSKIMETIKKAPIKGVRMEDGITQVPSIGVSFTRHEDGSIDYHATSVDYMKGCQKGVTVPPVWKARNEKVEELILRQCQDIRAKDEDERTRMERHNGKVMKGGKWVLQATDGHRALLVPIPMDGQKRETLHMDFSEGGLNPRYVVEIQDAELHLAVRRALIMAEEGNHTVKLTFEKGQVTVSSSHVAESHQDRVIGGNDAGDFEQDIEIQYSGPKLVIGINGQYLESALGVWPLRIWVKDAESMVVLGDMGDGYRVAIMPVKI